MKTRHIDSDDIANRGWKYTAGQELNETDVNRFIIYCTGIKEQRLVKSAVQKLEEDYGIEVEIYSIGALFDGVDDLEGALDEYNKGLRDVGRDELDTLFSDDPSDDAEKQFL